MKIKTVATILAISTLTVLAGCSATSIEKLQKTIQAIQGDTVKREQYPFTQQIGKIESQYAQTGRFSIAKYESLTAKPAEKFTVYYPNAINNNKKYPVIVFANGTGISASRYPVVLEHFASWGFIVIGNEDQATNSGKSTNASLAFLLSENNNQNSPLYQKIDTNKIGITGFSQGGGAVFTAMADEQYRQHYKTAIAVSPVNEELAQKNNYPTMVIAGTKGDFEMKLVSPLDKMTQMYNKINAPKLMARRIGADHDNMQFWADGYRTAWFMYHLQNDSNAGQMLTEITNNPNWQDVKVQ
jgi:hypothetical protein